MERSPSRERKEKKEKKVKKEKKEKKQKKHRDRSRQQKRADQRSISRDRKSIQNQTFQRDEGQSFRQDQKQEDKLQERTHVSCRRCKQNTFSLISRTCSNCGYPKQTRPANFPVVKQVGVLDLVRQGKLVHNSYAPMLMEIVVSDRMGKRQRIKCRPSDTVLQFKKLISAQIGTRAEKIRLQKANIIFKDHITLEDYQIKDGMGLQMYYD